MSNPTPSMSNPLGSGAVVESDPAQRSQAMIAHLLGIFSIVGTGIFYLIKKNDPTAGPFVKSQIKEAFNFQLAAFAAFFALEIVVMVIVAVLHSAIIGLLLGLLLMAAGLGVLILTILGAMKANKGEAVSYPVKIAVLK